MILCLSCVVVFCTVYALILPAITLERKTVCGQEEHSHTEECYSSDGQLTCGKTEHTHTESCYADDKTSEDQSGEDPQQTPEQNQTEGQEQNQGQSQEQNQNQDQSQDQSQSQDQVQTSDDGNVAQNGENGDTAGTTADETAGNDEESVVAGSTSAPAAEGEDGTGGTTTATEGFDLSKYTSKVESVSLYYQEKDENWKKIEENGSEEIPGDANIKLEVEYKDIQIQKLIQNHNCTLTYDLPDLLRNATPGGNIMEGSEIVGTLSISEGKIKVEFDQNYLEKKNNEGVTTIEGDFYITGEVNLSQLDKDGKKTLTTAGKTYKLDFGQDAIAKYGKVSVQKNCTSEKAISTTEGNFLSYTITVTAGEDGCPDVSVVDSLISNSDCVTYVGITSNATELAATSNEQKPYETIGSAKNSGKIYKGNAPTAEKPIPTEGETSITEPGSLVWKIGDMAPNERRTLTYYVKLKDDVALDNKEIKNQANVYSKTYKRVYDDATFTPKISYTMPKSRVGNIEKNTDGSYIINYELHFSLDKTNSNYPLENFVFQDYLKHSSNATDSKALPYISYDRTSVRVLVKTDGATDYNEIPKTEYNTSWSTDMSTYKTEWSDSSDGNPNSFKISGKEGKPIQVNLGDSYYVTYSVKVKPEALAAVKSDNVSVKNRWIASASNVYSQFVTGFNAYNSNNNVGGYKWDEKVVGTGTTADQTIEMTGDKYDLTSGEILLDTSAGASFTVPAGSYPYTVDVNQTLGDWDATNVLMKDTLDSDKMQYTGYAKVEAYSYDTTTKAYELQGTKWVKIDGLKTFELKPSDLGWSGQNYAYRFTYYAKPVNTGTFSTAIVNNKFELSGEVIRGGQKFDITGINSQKEVTISGEYRMNVNKESWYYEKPEASATEWTKGKIYWAIEVSGTAIKEGTYFKDSIVSGSDLTNSILKTDSLAGIYKGTLPEGKTLTGYSSLKDLQDNGNLTDVTEKFEKSGQNESKLQVKAKEQIALGQEKLYIIVRTEPAALPVKDRDYNTYRNSISTSDNGKTWIKQGEANELLCGAGDILKEFGQSFTYDGTTVISKNDGRDEGDSGKIAKDALPGAGQYASWVFKLNYAGELSGTYRVLETIPDGMELAYIRIKWTGTKQGTIESKEVTNLESDGWKKKTVTAGTDNNRSETTTYYVKDNKALIELGDFVNGKIRDDYSVDVQVVCKVTDPKVLLGGETKRFTNQVTLQTTDGQDINTATSPADITAQKIDKSMAATNPVSEKVNFIIKANQLGQTLPTVEGTTLKLIDKMSSTLILDTTTIKVVNSKDSKPVAFKASLGEDNTLTIEIPCNVPITITYTARVNAPPRQSVNFSNKAYWETYTPSSGTSVDQKNYSYTAGGTVGSGKNIWLKIIKKDQNNLSLGLQGAVFQLKKCTKNDDGTIKVDNDKNWENKTTDSNGEIQFGAGTSDDPAMDYNTLYQVMEVTAPNGYVKDDTPHYIMVPKKEDGAADYSDYVKSCIADPKINIQYQPIYELTISNHKGEITVEKKFKNPGGHDSNPVSGTYWVGLYGDENATGTPIQKIPITYSAGETGTNKNKFVDLDTKTTYYVFELDDKNQPIKDSSTVAIVNGMEYFTSYTTTKTGATESNSATNGDTVTVTNQSRVNKLPSTGSCGVLIYRLAGVILILFAGVLMLMKYKETKTRN